MYRRMSASSLNDAINFFPWTVRHYDLMAAPLRIILPSRFKTSKTRPRAAAGTSSICYPSEITSWFVRSHKHSPRLCGWQRVPKLYQSRENAVHCTLFSAGARVTRCTYKNNYTIVLRAGGAFVKLYRNRDSPRRVTLNNASRWSFEVW